MGPEGSIATILYPARSDLAATREDHLFIRLGATSGLKLLDALDGDLRDLVAYAHVSSIDMDASHGERIRIGTLRLTSPSGRHGAFEPAPWWSACLALGNFATGTAATAGAAALMKPIGIAAAILFLAWLGFDGVATLVRTLFAGR